MRLLGAAMEVMNQLTYAEEEQEEGYQNIVRFVAEMDDVDRVLLLAQEEMDVEMERMKRIVQCVVSNYFQIVTEYSTVLHYPWKIVAVNLL